MLAETHDGSTREGSWQPRPWLSRLLRLAVFVFPLGSALAATSLAHEMMPMPASRWGWVLWWAVLLGLGVVAAILTERVARRFLPLATLLKVSMLFPEQAPSRFRVARRAGSPSTLKRRHEPGQGVADDEGSSAATILALTTALSHHDRRTRGHSERVRVFTDLLSEQLKLPEPDRARLRWAALLHDVGKLSVGTGILNKREPLSEDEWGAIRRHPIEGRLFAAPLLEWLGPWGEAIVQHHERFDGMGYPNGLDGQTISYAARIVAVADVYDTMTSARSYRQPVATRAARQELVACAGTQFDPLVVRAFLEISLPKLLLATGPVSLMVHLPFLARLQQIGQASIASAATTATASVAAGVTAIGLIGPATPSPTEAQPIRPHPVVVVDATSVPLDGAGDGSEATGSGKGAGTAGGSAAGTDPGSGTAGGSSPGGIGSGSGTGMGSGSGTGTGSGTGSGSGTGGGGSGSGASDEVAVPDVVGMTSRTALQQLKQAGFVVVLVRQRVTDPAEKNIVIARSPSGSTAPPGSTITITVGKYNQGHN